MAQPDGSRPVDPRELRVSDAEREHVVGVLQRAIGRGLLDLDEFTARTDTALAARTRAELNAVLIDLPGLVHTEVGPAGGRVAAGPVELRTTMSTLRRTGRWSVPHELSVRNRMGSTDLDFTDAVFAHPEVRLDLEVAGGSVRLLLPPGATVNTDGLEVTAGTLKDRVGSGGGSGQPHLVVSGSIRAGSLAIRTPTYIRIGAMVIRFPWKISWDRD